MMLSQWMHGGLIFAGLSWPAAVAACAAALLAVASSFRNEPGAPGLPVFFLLLLLTVWGWIRWEWAGYPSAGFLSVSNLVSGFAAFGAVLIGLRSSNLRLALVGCIIAAGFAQLLHVASWGYLEEGMQIPWFSEQLKFWYEERYNPAISGSFMNRNHLVWLLNACCLLCLSLCVWARIPAFLKLVCGAGSVFFAFGTLLALSRGGALGLCAGLAVFVVFSILGVARTRTKYRLAALALLSVVVTGLLGASAYLILSRADVQERLERVGEDQYREQLWKAGIRQFEKAPLQGEGPGSFIDAARLFRPAGIGSGEAVYAHNDWLQLAAELGWVGLSLAVLTFLAAIFGGVTGIWERLRRIRYSGFSQSSHMATVIGAVSCLGAFAVHSVFDFNMQLSGGSMLAFCILGLAAAGASPSEQRGSRKLSFVSLWCAQATLALIASGFLWSSWPYFLDEIRLIQIENAIRRGPRLLAEELAHGVYEDGTRNVGRHIAAGEVWAGMASRSTDPDKKAGFRTRAAWHYLQASQLNPEDRFPFLRLAAMRAQRKEYGAAYLDALRGVELDPRSALPYEYLAGVCEIAGDPGQAIRIYEIAASLPGMSDFGRSRFQGLRRLQREGKLLSPAVPAIPVFRDSPPAPNSTSDHPPGSQHSLN